MTDVPRPRGRIALALAVAVGTGVLVALQSRINGDLGDRLGDGVLAAFISFGSGLVLLALGMLAWRPGRRGLARVAGAIRERRIPWWLTLGGLGGATFVMGQGLTVGLLGVALFTAGVVCGQTVSSLVVDHAGLARQPRTPATPRRVAGAALAVVAVLVAVGDRLDPGAEDPWWWLALLVPIGAGLIVGWQSAANGEIRAVSGSALTATFVNFLSGTTLIGIVLAVQVAVGGWSPRFPPEPWLYLGGLVGCAFIAIQAVVVRTTGALVLGLGVLAGQLAASVVFDVLAPVGDAALRTATAAGTALLLVAVVLAAWPGRRGTGTGPGAANRTQADGSGRNPSDTEFMQ